MIRVSNVDLERIDSLTQYPSTPTYHRRVGGTIIDEIGVEFDPDEQVEITEKIDGANARVTVLPDGQAIIGSRNELLAATTDGAIQRIYLPNDKIVETVAPYVQAIIEDGRELVEFDRDKIVTYYMESYGRVQNWKRYSDRNTGGIALFAIGITDAKILSWDRDKISAWRQSPGPKDPDELTWDDSMSLDGFAFLRRAPMLGTARAGDLPKGLGDTYEWMRGLLHDEAAGRVVTRAALVLDSPGLTRDPEGVVVANRDRTKVAKIRFDDYETALGLRASKRRKKTETRLVDVRPGRP